MSLAAGLAVAMHDRAGIGIRFVRHASAQAASSQHDGSNKVWFIDCHCERSEAIQLCRPGIDGLLRCARNDGAKPERIIENEKTGCDDRIRLLISHKAALTCACPCPRSRGG